MRTLAAVLGLGVALWAGWVQAAGQPNILIMIADDLGQRDLGCYRQGEESFYETPNLDRLAAQGVCFTHGYSSNPVCSPSRYALQTGRWPTRAGLTNFLNGTRVERFAGAPLRRRIDAAETTLAEALGPAGYRRVFAGKWHLGPDPADWPEHHGYDENLGGWAGGQPRSGFAPFANPRLPDAQPGEFLTTRLASESIAAMRRARQAGKPFLLVPSFYQVHTPLEAPRELIEKYQAKARRLGLVDRFGDEDQHHVSQPGARKVRQTQSHAVYAAMVEALDTAAGRLLAALDELGVAGETLVIFTSDNGGLSTAEGSPTSNLPLRGGKGWVFEGGIRVPFIVRWPAVAPPGRTEATPVSTVDIFPTVLAAAGVAAADVDGVNLAPLRRGGTLAPRDLFWHYPHYANQGGFPGGAIRAGDWKLVENYETGATALYNLTADPGESTDLAALHPERVTQLRGRLHEWYRQTGAMFLRARDDGGPQPWRPE